MDAEVTRSVSEIAHHTASHPCYNNSQIPFSGVDEKKEREIMAVYPTNSGTSQPGNSKRDPTSSSDLCALQGDEVDDPHRLDRTTVIAEIPRRHETPM